MEHCLDTFDGVLDGLGTFIDHMGKLALGYGSEWHMLRYLGRYRSVLDEKVRAVTRATEIRWLDWNSAPTEVDAEWKGISFLPTDARNRIGEAWAEWWPQRGNAHNWDAVAVLDGDEWLLVEAKAHLGELATSCAAVEGEGREMISRACAATRAALGAHGVDWLTGYYQMANRLAFLHFMKQNGVAARLLFVYFVGDQRTGGTVAPQTEAGWLPALEAQDTHLELPPKHPLHDRVHKLFLPVA